MAPGYRFLRLLRQNFDLRFIEELSVQRFESASELASRLNAEAVLEPVPDLKEIRLPQRDWEHWNEENKTAIDAYNQRVERDGLALAKYRSFAKGCQGHAASTEGTRPVRRGRGSTY